MGSQDAVNIFISNIGLKNKSTLKTRIKDWKNVWIWKDHACRRAFMQEEFFEIKFVEDDKPFYQLSNLPVYKLTTELF